MKVHRALRAAEMLAAFALACAHNSAAIPAASPGAKSEKPAETSGAKPAGPGLAQPDVAAIHEAVEAEACKPGEASAACPSESFEPQPYVSARAYSHLLTALLAVQGESYSAAADELREALLYDPESPHLHTLYADALVHLGRIGDADEELRAALAADPQHGPAHLLAARIAAARGHIGEARSHLRAVIEAQPESPEAYRELVHLEAAQPDADAALRIARDLEAQVHAVNARSQEAEKIEAQAQERSGIIEPDPDGALLASSIELREESGRAWEEVARAFADKHEDKAAQDAFAHAEAIDPGGLEQVSAHALFLETRRRFPEAREEELKLLARRPESPEILATLARLALEAGDPESSEAHLRKLIDLAAELDPSSDPRANSAEPAERADERRELASALLRSGLPLLGARRPAGAAPAFDAALRLLPGNPELLFYRGLSLGARGRSKEAAQILSQVAVTLEAHPSNSLLGIEPAALLLDARVQAALALGRAGEMGESLKLLKLIFQQNPLDEGASLGLLEGFDRAGKAADAVPLIAAALDGHAGEPVLLFALGSAQDRAGQLEPALQTMRRLLARAPDHSGALNYVGYALVEKGGAANLGDAQRLLERAVELRPDDGAIADSYGLCLLKLGRAQEALVELKRADALTPGDPVVLGHLGDALLATGNRQLAEETFRKALDRLEPKPKAKPERRGRAASRTPASEEPLEDRTPEANDDKVKAELLQKLRALTSP